MRIVVANAAVPFVRGGAELLADRLCTQLRRAGHETELVRLPLGQTPRQISEGILAAGLMNLQGSADRLIALKAPGYFVPHDDLVIWLVHQFRQAYDPPPVGWGSHPELDPVVAAMRAADTAAFARAQQLYAISPVVAERLHRSNGLVARVLMTPPHSTHGYRTEPAERFMVALGRISPGKRQLMAIEAMAHARPGYHLVVAGAADSPDVLDEVRRRVDDLGLSERVELIPRFITDEEKVDLLARCAGSVYLPIDEDSYGYVCYEAAMSAKPSITATDSGGTHTLVEDGVTGYVCPPDAPSVAAAMDALALDLDTACAMGIQARERALALDLSWDRVIEALTR